MFPAASVARAVITYVPSARAAPREIVYDPPADVPEPTRLPAMKSCTVAPASAEPVSRGVLSLVIPSPCAPESSAASRPGAAGAAGGFVSIVRVKGAGRGFSALPAASMAMAVTE